MGEQKDRVFYNDLFGWKKAYSRNFLLSKYVPIWQKALESFEASCAGKSGQNIDVHAFDMGCGTGQFIDFFMTNIISENIYITGLDFSNKGISIARKMNKKHKNADFLLGNVFDVDPTLLPKSDYLFSFEFLEHIVYDKLALTRIGAIINRDNKSLLPFSGSVPDFKSPSHVRHFKDEQQVADRYKNMFEEGTFRVERVKEHYFLFEGLLKI